VFSVDKTSISTSSIDAADCHGDAKNIFVVSAILIFFATFST
jgi:hypothetical protein